MFKHPGTTKIQLWVRLAAAMISLVRRCDRREARWMGSRWVLRRRRWLWRLVGTVSLLIMNRSSWPREASTRPFKTKSKHKKSLNLNSCISTSTSSCSASKERVSSNCPYPTLSCVSIRTRFRTCNALVSQRLLQSTRLKKSAFWTSQDDKPCLILLSSWTWLVTN